MPELRLTPAFCRDATGPTMPADPGTKASDRIEYLDTAVKGLRLIVTATGHKSWRVHYRPAPRSPMQKPTMTFVKPQNLEAARKWATGVLGDVAKGGDPVEERRQAKLLAENARTTTVKAIIETYIEQHFKPTRGSDGKRIFSKRSHGETTRVLEKDAIPIIGHIPLQKLKRSDLRSMHDIIAIDRGSPTQAFRAFAYFRGAMTWFVTKGPAPDDFSAPILIHMRGMFDDPTGKGRALFDDEIRDLWAGLDQAKDDLPGFYPRLIKTLFFSGLRLRACAHAPWTEITLPRDEVEGYDAERPVWTIPGNRVGVKRQNAHAHTPHVVPLTDNLISLIGADRPASTKFLFSTPRGEASGLPPDGFGKPKAILDKAINDIREKNGRPPMDWDVHYLRHTAKTLMARANGRTEGVATDRIQELVMGHIIPGVDGRYDHYDYLVPKYRALLALEAEIKRVLARKT